MGKITEYSEVSRLAKTDVLLVDGPDGTRIIKLENAGPEIVGMVSSVNHRNVFRGKNLGGGLSSKHKQAIKEGSFDDLFIGDYWVINGVTYRIADMDYFLHCGDAAFERHHLVIVPDGQLYTHVMNDTHTTDGGYVGSKMYTEGLNQAKNTIAAAFGELVTTHRDYFTNAVTSGYPAGGAWFDSTVELMNERMVYGNPVFSPMGNGSFIPTNYQTGKSQLALFRIAPQFITNRNWYWLRDVVSSTYFALVSYVGYAFYYAAGDANGVRPYFVISVA